MKFVALLRGINVGKSVQVPMKSLKAVCEGLGLVNVVTYLNSGNVIFEADLAAADLTPLLENQLERTFGQRVPTLVKTADEIRSIEAKIPKDWHNDATQQTYVAYLFGEADRPDLVAELPIKTAYVNLFYTRGAIVWNIRRENYNRSQITKLAAHPAYGHMTTRNVNTARQLAELCTGDEGLAARLV